MSLQPGSRPVPSYPDYILIRKLGAGAFGEVWQAHGPGGVDVALKFILLDTHVRALELRSLEVMKSIRHPNLVSLFGAWHKDNWLILAMELCDRTLRDRLAEALYQNLPGIPLEELLNYMADAANGLDALNAKQVQHRDVKPANLLLLNSVVKVADFGLAKALEQTVASNSGAGTLAYTAPECFKGKLTQQSDQYSLAVTYYHLRTGHPLFNGDQAQVMYAHLELEPDLAHLPPAEGVVLARALSKEPGKRWANCKVFVNELTVAAKPLVSRGIASLARIDILAMAELKPDQSIARPEQLRAYRLSSKKLSQALGREPTIAEIAKVMGISIDKVGWLIKQYFGVPNQRLCKDMIDRVLKTLTYRERTILDLRYGLAHGFVYTYEEIGRIFKVTPESVRQIEAKAVRKLQHPVRLRGLEGLFDIFATKGLTEQELQALPEGRLICKIDPFRQTKPTRAEMDRPGDHEKSAITPDPLLELNLSVRARKCLQRLGITSLDDLISRTAEELLESKKFSETCLNEVRDKLAEYGLTLRAD